MVIDLCERQAEKTRYVNIQLSLDETKRLLCLLPPGSLEAVMIARVYARSLTPEVQHPGP